MTNEKFSGPEAVQAEQMLLHLVESNLAHYLSKSAHFFAEKLYSLFPSESSLHAIAKCYYADRKIKQTYLLLQGCTSALNRYLLTLACIDLEKYDEGERALMSFCRGTRSLISSLATLEDVKDIPGGAAGLYLMGRISRKQHRKESAIHFFKLSLELDPCFWCSVSELCELGVDMEPLFPVDFEAASIYISNAIAGMPVQSLTSQAHENVPPNRVTPLIGAKSSLHNKLMVERISLGSAQFGGSPHTATSLGLSSSAFHVPFASPGGIPSFRGGSQFSDTVFDPDALQNTRFRSSSRTDFDPSSILSGPQSTGGRQAGLPSAKLFNMSSPALTPIQLQSESFIDSTPTSLPFRQNMNPGDLSNYNQSRGDGNRSLRFDNRSQPSTVYDPAHSITPPVPTNDKLNSSNDNLNIALSPPTHQGRKVNFGPNARLSLSSTVGIAQGLNFEDMTDVDEHPPKFLRTGLLLNQDPLDENKSSSVDKDRGQSSVRFNIGRQEIVQSEQSLLSQASADAAYSFIISLLVVFGAATSDLTLYRCQTCIDKLHSLPPVLFASGYVHQLIGKAYFELNDYKLSVLSYREMQRLEPFRTQGLEYLSSALWHLKKDKELCALAQQVVELDKMSAESWCVVGNCFSLQREPDSAMTFFARAIQLESSYPYAHTLLGHEYVHNEDFERAVQSFRTAILHDDRHYNAWYGLGAIYYRQERFELAEYHFRRAISINSSSSVLSCYLAMVLHAQNKPEKTSESLDILSSAIVRDPKNAQLHFQRAHVLMSIDELDEVIGELEVVRGLAPKEPPVYSLLGRAYQRLGNVDEALRNFQTAIDLDPKEAGSLKMELEALGEPSLDGILEQFI